MAITRAGMDLLDLFGSRFNWAEAVKIGALQSHLLTDKASLSKIRKLVRMDLVKAGAGPSIVFDCLVAVTEACAIAMHSRSEKVGEPSRFTWNIDRGYVEFCVEDFGVLIKPEPDHPKRRIHEVVEAESGMEGLGEGVIQGLMDEVKIEEDDRSRTTTMTKRLN
jgi:anti-sigma regulatory factor (Ser/Thr protein kinase)